MSADVSRETSASAGRYRAGQPAPDSVIQGYADAVACQAEAIAAGTVVGPRYAAVLRLQSNVSTLLALTPDDRDHTRKDFSS